ncbi:MAG: prepilin-type N-terminal cleavage/methylation domain-containing protein [Cyanobacteriota bacterium]|nr:prepilin-type N-terminal cleavage/methylation domain-containing protein [Cyanobacteriota bacterium]
MSVRYIRSLLEIFNKQRLKTRKNRQGGFTLTELLVTIILGSLIVAGLMGLVVELLTTEARETARTETQREMQMALDYISTDLREAVYVYDGACLSGEDQEDANGNKILGSQCKGLFNHIDVPQNSTPVLAFWKLDPLPEAVGCGDGGVAGVPCLSGRSYTLVVYFLRENQQGEPWRGMSRILRYELPQFTSDGTEVAGYISPETISFGEWPGDNDPDGGFLATLVDFVDSRPLDDNDLKESVGDNGQAASVQCPSGYTLTPSDDTLEQNGFPNLRNFYACVRVPQSLLAEGGGQTEGSFNQKVILFVRGNALGKPGIDDANEGFMPAIATQVLNRGIRGKVPLQ